MSAISQHCYAKYFACMQHLKAASIIIDEL